LLNAFANCASAADVEALVTGLDAATCERLCFDWQLWARDDQLPPGQQDWRTWLVMGGRGAGKTRTGAEWVRGLATVPRLSHVPRRIALIGRSHADARAVMVEGISGLLSVHPDRERPRYEASLRQLTWPNGTIAQIFSAEEPDGLRGPQFEAAWCDEICKWPHADATWDMLQFALRLGQAPRQVVTTTPRRMPLIERLLAASDCVVSRAATTANRAHLSSAFIAAMEDRYRGTRLGRQELDGELVDDAEDSLWKRIWFERSRAAVAPVLERTVVAVDPPVTSGPRADACGIIVAGLGADGRAYVLADCTLTGHDPATWARAVIAAYEAHAADRIVAEVNQGGDLVEMLLRQVTPDIAVRKVRATRGKWVRAEPVAALYERDRVSHVGAFPELEDQLCAFGPAGLGHGRSPDRMDALVWALTDLLLSRASPRLRGV
jgi:phage terminase large subunit-like protein